MCDHLRISPHCRACLEIFDPVASPSEQRAIMALVLYVSCTRKKVTSEARELIRQMARKFGMSQADVRDICMAIASEDATGTAVA